MADDSDDDEIWKQITESAARLKTKKRVPRKTVNQTSRKPNLKAPAVELDLLPKLEPQRGFERRFIGRVKASIKYKPVLDLHGLTVDGAYVALNRFLKECYETGERVVTVITGKGAKEESIAGNFPKWMQYSELAKLVISYDNAPLELGGTGAWILHLRKK